MHRPDWEAALGVSATRAVAHLAGLPDRPVGAPGTPADLLATFDRTVPRQGLPAEQVLAELANGAEPGLTAMNSGRFFGWVIGGSTPAGLGADWLVSAWEQNTAMVEATPATVVIEQVAARWIVELLELPSDCSVGFVTGGQMANWVGLAAGRNAVLTAMGWDVEADGLQGAPKVTVIAGDEWHSTIPRALRYLGLGSQTAVLVDSDDNGAMLPAALDAALAGVDGPVLVAAQVGNVNSGAIDPVGAIVDVLDRHRGDNPGRIWLHVDGAFGLWAAASPTRRHLVAGVERADSWGTDAHKWLNVPYDCGVAITRHPDAHRRAVSTRASYIPAGDSGFRHPIDHTPEFSRRARGVPVWATIRELGAEGVTALVDRCCDHASRFAEQLAAQEDVEVLNDVVLNQVVVRFLDPQGDHDAHNAEVAERIWADGTCVATPTTWRGVAALRISVSNWLTDAADVDASVVAMLRAHRG